MTASELTFFTVTGHWYDVENTLTSGATNTPQTMYVSAFITFTPRLPPGTTLYVADFDISTLDQSGGTTANSAIVITPITGRILEGELQVINRDDTADVQLVANTPNLCDSTGVPLPTLIYDVAFDKVAYAGVLGKMANFAFTAPTTTGQTIDLTDPALTRLEYNPSNYPTGA